MNHSPVLFNFVNADRQCIHIIYVGITELRKGNKLVTPVCQCYFPNHSKEKRVWSCVNEVDTRNRRFELTRVRWVAPPAASPSHKRAIKLSTMCSTRILLVLLCAHLKLFIIICILFSECIKPNVHRLSILSCAFCDIYPIYIFT